MKRGADEKKRRKNQGDEIGQGEGNRAKKNTRTRGDRKSRDRKLKKKRGEFGRKESERQTKIKGEGDEIKTTTLAPERKRIQIEIGEKGKSQRSVTIEVTSYTQL